MNVMFPSINCFHMFLHLHRDKSVNKAFADNISAPLVSSPPALERPFGFYANITSAYKDVSFDQDKWDGRR